MALLKDRLGNIILPQTRASLVYTTTSNVAEELETIKSRLDKNKGVFLSLSALQSAYPTAEDGDWAIVNAVEEEPKKYIWDGNDTGWYLMGFFSGVESVNGENGDVVLFGGDINSILNIDGTDTTQTLTQWLQALRNDLDTVEISAESAKPKTATFTLSSASWSTNTYTLDLTGTDLDGLDNQLFTLKFNTIQNFIDYEIYIDEASSTTTSLVFTCETEPTEDVDITIIYQIKGGI